MLKVAPGAVGVAPAPASAGQRVDAADATGRTRAPPAPPPVPPVEQVAPPPPPPPPAMTSRGTSVPTDVREAVRTSVPPPPPPPPCPRPEASPVVPPSPPPLNPPAAPSCWWRCPVTADLDVEQLARGDGQRGKRSSPEAAGSARAGRARGAVPARGADRDHLQAGDAVRDDEGLLTSREAEGLRGALRHPGVRDPERHQGGGRQQRHPRPSELDGPHNDSPLVARTECGDRIPLGTAIQPQAGSRRSCV